MKKNFYLPIVIILLIFSSININAAIKESDVKTTLTKIFDLSTKKDYANASKFLFNKKLKTRVYNYTDKSEIKAVKRICKKIKAYLDLSDSYEFDVISLKKYNNLPSANLKVNFKSGNQELTITFVFVEHSGKILLVNFK